MQLPPSVAAKKSGNGFPERRSGNVAGPGGRRPGGRQAYDTGGRGLRPCNRCHGLTARPGFLLRHLDSDRHLQLGRHDRELSTQRPTRVKGRRRSDRR